MQTSWIRAPVVSSLIGAEGESSAAVPLDFFVRQLEASRDLATNPLALWTMGEEIRLAALGCLGEAIAASATLGKALRVFAQGFGLVQSNTDVQMEVDGDEVHVSYRVLDPHIWPRRADAELSLGLIRGICEAFALNRDAYRAVSFEHDTAGEHRPLSQHLGCLPRFGQDENRITLAASALSQRRRDTCPEDEKSSWKTVESAIISQRRETPLSERVRGVILGRIGRTVVNQQAVAVQLGLSDRSLRRGLAAENRPFHEILEECRRIQGFALLVRTERPLSEIALALGYSDQTAFSRAFSRWFGVSPRELRRNGATEESVIR